MIQPKQPKKTKGTRKKRKIKEKEVQNAVLEKIRHDFTGRINADVLLILAGGTKEWD